MDKFSHHLIHLRCPLILDKSLLSRPRAKSEGRKRSGDGSYAKPFQEYKREVRCMFGRR